MGTHLSDLRKVIAELEQQKQAIEKALAALREIASPTTTQAAPSKRRGRPPAQKQSRMTDKGRERLRESMKKRWAAKRAAKRATKRTAKKKAAQ